MRRSLVSAVLLLAALGAGRSAGAQYRWIDQRGVVFESARFDRIPPRYRNEVYQPPRARPPSGSQHDVPLAGGGKHLIVQGTFNGILSGPMLVDTGASYCVLTRESARRLGLVASKGASIPVTTANGQVAADLVALDSVQVEGARLTGVDAVIMDAVEPPLVGIIGLSFLNHFRYSVDHARGTILLER